MTGQNLGEEPPLDDRHAPGVDPTMGVDPGQLRQDPEPRAGQNPDTRGADHPDTEAADNPDAADAATARLADPSGTGVRMAGPDGVGIESGRETL